VMRLLATSFGRWPLVSHFLMIGRRLLAPLGHDVVAFWPSMRVRMSARSTALMCTNTPLLPSLGSMNPKPFSASDRVPTPSRPRVTEILCVHSPEEAGFVEDEKVIGVRVKSGL